MIHAFTVLKSPHIFNALILLILACLLVQGSWLFFANNVKTTSLPSPEITQTFTAQMVFSLTHLLVQPEEERDTQYITTQLRQLTQSSPDTGIYESRVYLADGVLLAEEGEIPKNRQSEQQVMPIYQQNRLIGFLRLDIDSLKEQNHIEQQRKSRTLWTLITLTLGLLFTAIWLRLRYQSQQ